MTTNPLPPDDDTPDDPLGIDPELIKELDEKSKEIVAEAVAAGNIGSVRCSTPSRYSRLQITRWELRGGC